MYQSLTLNVQLSSTQFGDILKGDLEGTTVTVYSDMIF